LFRQKPHDASEQALKLRDEHSRSRRGDARHCLALPKALLHDDAVLAGNRY